MTISQEVLQIIDGAEKDGNILRIVERLDRSTYEKVNKALVAAGGKWNRAKKGHLFDVDAYDAVSDIILYGEVFEKKKDLGQFFTPPALAERLVELARIDKDSYVLEPSAGHGAIISQIQKAGAQYAAFEIDPVNCRVMADAGMQNVIQGDFLSITPDPLFDAIVMNPPFAKKADVRHVRHAMQFLKSGGRLVSVMGAGILFRQDREIASLRDDILKGGYIETLDPGTFRASGTMVNTVLVFYRKP